MSRKEWRRLYKAHEVCPWSIQTYFQQLHHCCVVWRESGTDARHSNLWVITWRATQLLDSPIKKAFRITQIVEKEKDVIIFYHPLSSLVFLSTITGNLNWRLGPIPSFFLWLTFFSFSLQESWNLLSRISSSDQFFTSNFKVLQHCVRTFTNLNAHNIATYRFRLIEHMFNKYETKWKGFTQKSHILQYLQARWIVGL